MARITVTDENIDLGDRNDADSCAVQLAVQPLLKEQYVVSVNRFQLNITDCETMEPEVHAIPLPQEVTDWINRFDFDEGAEPFSFDAAIPVVMLREEQPQ